MVATEQKTGLYANEWKDVKVELLVLPSHISLSSLLRSRILLYYDDVCYSYLYDYDNNDIGSASCYFCVLYAVAI